MTSRNVSCGEPSFFESTRYILVFTHLVTVLSIPVSVYVLYCIVYVTPRNMNTARKHLLIVHFWTMTFDVVFNLLNAPLLFFPSASFVMLGYGYDMGIPARFQYYLIQAIVCVIAMANNGLFENRFSSITTNQYRLKENWMRFLLHIFNYCVAFFVVVPPYLTDIDLDSIRINFLKTLPCPPSEFFTDRFAVVTDQPHYITLFMFIQFMICLPQSIFFTSYSTYLLVHQPNKSVSDSTRKIQYKFLVALIVQCSIPHIFLLIPVLYIWFSAWTDYYNAAYNNHIVALVSLHGLCATLCILVIHKPYRDHFMSLFEVRIAPSIIVSSQIL